METLPLYDTIRFEELVLGMQKTKRLTKTIINIDHNQ